MSQKLSCQLLMHLLTAAILLVCHTGLFNSVQAQPDPLARTILTRPAQGIAQLGQAVEVACSVARPADVVMVRLRKLPLGAPSAPGEEVFAASMPGGKQRLHSPWDTRTDLHFNGSALSVQFNMNQADEGLFRCDAVTLDGESPGNTVELLTAQAATSPRLLFNGATPSPADRLEIVQGDSVTVNCSANVGKPPGDLQLTFVASDHREQPLVGAANATWTGPIPVTGGGSSDTVVTTIFKSVVAAVQIEEAHQNGSFVCRLAPNSMASAAAGRVNTNSSSSNSSSTLVAASPPVEALYGVRSIRMQPYRENFFHGDSLVCEAEGRPAPAIAWSKIQGIGDLPVNGSVLLMPVGARPGYYSYTCSATNSVKGSSHQLLQSIGFNLHNRTAAPTQPAPAGGGSVSTRLQSWVLLHQRGVVVALICVGSLAGLGLIGVAVICLCGGGTGAGAAYNRLLGSTSGGSGNLRERMRYYGELGEAGALSSDEDDEDGYHLTAEGSRQLLAGKAEKTAAAAAAAAGGNKNSGDSSWNGTQV